MSERRVVRGVLGWSNIKTGCEFYQDTEAPRWEKPREAYLTDALGDPEGSRVIVIVSRDRFDNMDDLYGRIVELVERLSTSSGYSQEGNE